MFVGDGDLLDQCPKRSRKQEREERAKKAKLEHDIGLGNGEERGIALNQRQSSIHLALKMSSSEREKITNNIDILQVQLNQLVQEKGQSMRFLTSMYQGNHVEMKSDPMYLELNEMTEQIKQLRKEIEKAKEQLQEFNTFKDVYGTQAKTLMDTLSKPRHAVPLSNVTSTVDRNSCFSPLSMISTIPSADNNVDEEDNNADNDDNNDGY
jgi:hypothetical protein